MSIQSIIKTYFQVRKLRKFEFQNPGLLSDGEIELHLFETCSAKPLEGSAPEYHFHIYRAETHEITGFIDFRVFLTDDLKRFGGNIGYGIYRHFRGNHYSAKALCLLIKFIRNHGLSFLLITCEETNIASRKTCENVGARLVKIEKTKTDMNEIKPVRYYVLDLTNAIQVNCPVHLF